MENSIKMNEKLRAELQQKINSYKFCWICGRDKHLTKHHVISKKIKEPLMNLTINLCENCHKLIDRDKELGAVIRRML